MTAARRYYAFDLAPTFWRALVGQATNGRIVSVDRVRTDIEHGKDDLAEWATHIFDPWFDSTEADDVVTSYRRIMAWALAQGQFTDAAKAEFASASDGWLVAYALARGCVVVTNEV